jgi:hypothetical protein
MSHDMCAADWDLIGPTDGVSKCQSCTNVLDLLLIYASYRSICDKLVSLYVLSPSIVFYWKGLRVGLTAAIRVPSYTETLLVAGMSLAQKLVIIVCWR